MIKAILVLFAIFPALAQADVSLMPGKLEEARLAALQAMRCDPGEVMEKCWRCSGATCAPYKDNSGYYLLKTILCHEYYCKAAPEKAARIKQRQAEEEKAYQEWKKREEEKDLQEKERKRQAVRFPHKAVRAVIELWKGRRLSEHEDNMLADDVKMKLDFGGVIALILLVAAPFAYLIIRIALHLPRKSQ